MSVNDKLAALWKERDDRISLVEGESLEDGKSVQVHYYTVIDSTKNNDDSNQGVCNNNKTNAMVHTDFFSVSAYIKKVLFQGFVMDYAQSVTRLKANESVWKPEHKYYALSETEICTLKETELKYSVDNGKAVHKYLEDHLVVGESVYRCVTEWEKCPLYRGCVTKGRSIVSRAVAKFAELIKRLKRQKGLDYTLVRKEWPIFDEQLKLCGTLDALYSYMDVESGQERFVLVDYKVVKNIYYQSLDGRTMGIHPFSKHAQDANGLHYQMQLNLYALLLWRRYEIYVDQAFLFNLHPDYPCATAIEVPLFSEEVYEEFVQCRLKEVQSANEKNK